jgi:cobaltochelatase CobS
MARKPKFGTPEGAERWALEKGAPRRGSGTPITSLTRGLARNWVVASGVPSSEAYTLSVEQLSEAWHDLSGAVVARLKGEPAPTPITPAPFKPVPFKPEDFPAPTPVPVMEINMPTTDHEAKLKALMDILKPDAPALDEAQVLEIVARHMGNTISTATAAATENARAALSDIVEEARAIVNGAPRVLRIDIKGRTRELPAAPRHHSFDVLLTMTVCGREKGGLPVMLVGPAGGGKTTGAEHVAAALGLPFYSNGALTGAHELTGYKDGAGHYHTTPFRQAFEHGGLYLMDEADRSDPAVLVALNSAIANGFMGFPDRAEPVRAHPDFVVMIAANTYGRGADRLYVGANQMDGSTTDRFVPLNWEYDEVLERTLASDDAWVSYVQAARKAAFDLKVRHIISPRASMAGAVLRRAGLAFDLVTDCALWKGLDADQRARITDKIPESVKRRAQVPTIAIAAE